MNLYSKERVVIIIPTYNEALAIEETVRSVFSETKANSNFDIQVLIFDSCSKDETQILVKKLQDQFEKLHLMIELEKTGLGSAYRQAMQYAMDKLEADIIVQYDADGSHQPKYINPILNLLKTNDVVIGSRYVKGGKIPPNWGIHRKFFSIVGNRVARLLLHPRCHDLTGGFRATRTKILKEVLPEKFLSNQYSYNLHLFWLLHKGAARIIEYPIEFIDRTQGESKLPANSIIDSLRVVVTLRCQEMKRYFKMCSVGAFGAIVQLIVFNQLRTILPIEGAAQCAIGAAILSNFILNQRYTFKDVSLNLTQSKSMRLVRQFIIFILYSIFMVKAQSKMIIVMSSSLSSLGQGLLIENISMCIAIALGSVLNYFIYSKYVWPLEKKILRKGHDKSYG